AARRAHSRTLAPTPPGDPPIVPTAAAIVNAIRDATGADVRSLPVTREEMLRALNEARERERKLETRPARIGRGRDVRARERLARARGRDRARAAAALEAG